MAALLRLAPWLWTALVAATSARSLVLAGPLAEVFPGVGDVEVARGIAYLATTRGLQVLDATNPAAGYTPLGSFSGSFTSLELRGTLAYLVGPGWLQIVDVADPGSPVGLGAVPVDGEVQDLDVVEGLAYVAVGPPGLRIIDVSNPAAPTRSAHWTSNHPTGTEPPASR